MAAGYVTGEQKIDGRFKIGGRAFGGALLGFRQPTTRTVPTHAQPHSTHSPYICDNGGKWNHSLQRCDCLDGFGGKTLNCTKTCAQKHILNKKTFKP